MTKYEDFKGEISVDFEGNTTQKDKIKEFFDIDLHKDDCIVGIDFSVGEYHHNRKNNTLKSIKFFVVNSDDLKKSEEDRKVKIVEATCKDFEQFFAFFKRSKIELRPHYHKFTN